MALTNDQQQEENTWELLRDEINADLEQFQKEWSEIDLMLEQNKVEVNKLAVRNASITAHLQQVYAQFESFPRADIRMAYDAALDAQQRLFFMRGQLEKLQSDQAHLDRLMAFMRRVKDLLEGGASPMRTNVVPASTDVLEMVIQAQESERQRLSRQMHDGPAQVLSNFILQSEIVMRLFDLDQSKARDELTNLKQSATSVFQQVRAFIFDLRPMMLDDLGLIPTIKRYVEAFKDKSGVDVRLTVTGSERRLESYLEVLLFRAFQELLGNASLRGQASQIKAQLEVSDSNVILSIDDNGQGFNVENLDKVGGMGLKVIKDRVKMLGGYFEIESAIGQGTRVKLQAPVGRVEPFTHL